jgi:hypothetical protein
MHIQNSGLSRHHRMKTVASNTKLVVASHNGVALRSAPDVGDAAAGEVAEPAPVELPREFVDLDVDAD